MTREIINVGTAPNDGTGDPLRTAYIKINNNFGELYSTYQTIPPVTLVGAAGDIAGMYASDASYFYYCFADYDGSTTIWAQISEVGNISATQIVNGTSNVKINGPNGIVTISSNGVANLAVFNSGSTTLFSGLVVNGNADAGNVSTTGRISAVGNVTGNYFLGNGSLLTGIVTTSTANAIVNGTTTVRIGAANGNANVTVGGTSNVVVFTSTGANIAGTVSATGNITGGNISTAANISAQGIISASGNIITSGYFVGNFLGNVTGNFVVPGSTTQVIFNTSGAADAVAGLTYDKGSNTLSVLGIVSAQGNVTGNYFIGNGSQLTGLSVSSTRIFNGTTEANIGVANGNANISVGGTSNVAVFATTGVFVTGRVSANGNVTGGNLTTGGLITATGNVTGGNIRTGGQVSATGNVTGGNIIGGVITTIGNITGGNIAASGILTITGNITSNDHIQGNVINGTTVTGTTLSASGNVTGGNLLTGGLISATGNITGGNVNTARVVASSFVSAAGNVVGGNLNTAGLISATGNVVGGNLNTAGLISATGNIISGNILTGGAISATGNVTGAFLFGNASTVTGLSASKIFNGTTEANVGVANGNANISVNGTSNVAVFATTGVFVTGVVSATGNISGGNLVVTGNLVDTGAMTIITSSNGNITLSPNGTGVVVVNTDIRNGQANGVGNIGNSSTYFNTVFAKSTSAQYADVAEYYVSDFDYEPGTVVKFGTVTEITIADQDHDSLVAGVVSENPAFIMNSGIIADCVSAVALVGRVLCKVRGPVKRGQMMVSAGDGHARAETAPGMGTVIGKSLENFDGEVGEIEILVGRL
jgi:hypothetical protein